MTEPPIESGTDGIQPRVPRVGHRMLDFTIAAVAIVISLISLGVGFFNARSEQRMVAASSWPFLVYGTARSGDANGDKLSLNITNQGVGPARLKYLVVRYNGREARGLVELLHLCCGLPPNTSWDQMLKLGLVRESRAVGIVSPRDSIDLVVIVRNQMNTQVWDKLEKARLHLSLEACYCSVLNECWTTNLGPTTDPVPVDECPMKDNGYIE